MKKLIIALAAVAMVAGAQAAAVSWASGEMVTASGADAGKDDITMYIWEVTSSVYSNYSSITDASALTQKIVADYGDKTASATLSKGTANSGKATVVGADDKTANQAVYAILLFVDNTATGDAAYIGNYYTGTVPEVGNLATANLGLKIGGTGAATSWTTAAVPEPTSGLLLLLGVAGLALKRKRA